MLRHPHPSRRRAFATVLVLIVVGIASIILVRIQTAAWRGAAAGREAVAAVRAKWAARAGIEATIAALATDTLDPDPGNAFATRDLLAGVATARFAHSSYSIRHWDDAREEPGPADAHARLNINLMTAEALLLIPNMTEDVADSILDWIDDDDDANPLGAEAGYYLSLPNPYLPRNAPIRTIQELELIAGVRPDLVRGEDWNLSGDLDPEEDGMAPPPGSLLFSSLDGKLDAGWSAYLTASSADGGYYSLSGEPRLDLTTAAAEDLVRRLDVTTDQAEIIIAHATASAAPAGATMADFIRSDLASLAPQVDAFGAPVAPARVEPLTDDQLAALLDETWIGDPTAPAPGRLNVNTCTAETLQYLPGIDSALADSIIIERNASQAGFTSLLDLLEVPAMTRALLAELSTQLCTRSNVYTVTSRGRDDATGTEAVITATIDRSTLPVVIKDLIIR